MPVADPGMHFQVKRDAGGKTSNNPKLALCLKMWDVRSGTFRRKT